MDAEAIADAIIETSVKFGLKTENLIGQGYDGCSTMAGKDNGVQTRIKSIPPKAAFVHCSSHRLNLVVTDLNSVPDVRNAIGTVKAVIKFFCDSPKRRKQVPNLQLLCETRWTAKYKSIRIFAENFVAIVKALENLSKNELETTRQTAHQLFCASTTANFLVTLRIIARYSALLEPITQSLKAVNLDLLGVQEHIQKLLNVLRSHRSESEQVFTQDIMPVVKQTAEELSIDLSLPRRCGRQMFRSNPDSNSFEDYFRKSVFIPYLDSILQSLQIRFGEDNKPHFSLFALHPAQLSKNDRTEIINIASKINSIYEIDNLESEVLT
ncbi:zinc finger MYM-type protein 1-like [Patiria miniata]|uniref:Uncharacterized protein n=1 Tax=Patiria miniata TaxID=46514 RepID=A0A914AH12_PATMI|nr:zinc finger MYM-type protein 1-like [Patiria miniata]